MLLQQVLDYWNGGISTRTHILLQRRSPISVRFLATFEEEGIARNVLPKSEEGIVFSTFFSHK